MISYSNSHYMKQIKIDNQPRGNNLPYCMENISVNLDAQNTLKVASADELNYTRFIKNINHVNYRHRSKIKK